MARQIITATLTYSSQTNRDAALTRINTAIAAYTYVNITTGITTGVTTSGTTVINISIEAVDGTDGNALGKAIYDAAVNTTRQTSGYLSVNVI